MSEHGGRPMTLRECMEAEEPTTNNSGTPRTDAMLRATDRRIQDRLSESVKLNGELEAALQVAREALTKIMHARRNPDVVLTDMSRAGMREIAGEALAKIAALADAAQAESKAGGRSP